MVKEDSAHLKDRITLQDTPVLRMHLEIKAAVEFLVKILGRKNTLEPDQLDSLGQNLECLLNDRYQGHWYPDKPDRGQAYRCIRINSWKYVDESLIQACKQCGIEYSKLSLPKEIAVWIDPFEVCGRLGEDAEYFTIATFHPVIKEEPVCPECELICLEHKPVPDCPEDEHEPTCPERETSDYSSDGSNSESSSENSLDDEMSEGKLKEVEEKLVFPPTCTSPDEAIASPSVSQIWTPVELLASEQETDGTDATVAHETTYGEALFLSNQETACS